LVEVLKILEESKEANVNNRVLLEKSTQLTNLSKELKIANEELIHKDKQKDEFLDTVAHELKIPLTGIRAATELLLNKDDHMPQEMKEKFLQNILQDADRLNRLIHNILDFEKLSTGRDTLILKKRHIKNTIDKALNSCGQIASKKDIVIHTKDIADFELRYDKDRIVQVLTNFLSNAIKFCEPKKGIIIIDCERVEGFLKVNVTDNGSGIPSEDFNYIFEKFYQSKNQNTIKP